MNFIKRALLSVLKRKGKNLILALTLSIVAVFILSGYAIGSAFSKTQESFRSKIGANVTLEFDVEKAMAEFQKNNPGQSGGIRGETIPLETVKKIAENEHITGYNYVLTSSGVADNFKSIYDEKLQKQMQEMMKSNGKNYEAPNLNVTGARDTSLLDVFVSGQYKLIKGKHIRTEDADKNFVLIEETLAEKNRLKIGDTIKMHWQKDPAKKLELQITGIYSAPPVDPVKAGYAILNPVNNLIMSSKNASTLGNSNSEELDTITYYLDSPDSIDSFKMHVKKYVDLEVFRLVTDEEAYKRITGPLKNVSIFVNGMIIVIAMSACLILGLVILLSLRNRKKEFGILLSVGENKNKIIGQVIIEILVPMLISIAVAIPSANLMAVSLGQKLLQNEIQNIELQNQSGDEDGSSSVVSSGINGSSVKTLDAETIKNIDISVSKQNYYHFLLIYTIIVLITVILPLVSILRLSPKSILAKHG